MLLNTIKTGAASTDYFGYAMSVDAQGNYQGLYFGRQPATIYDDDNAVIIRPDDAREAQARQAAATAASAGAAGAGAAANGGGASTSLWQGSAPSAATASGAMHENGGAYAAAHATGPAGAPATTMTTAPTTFFGSVELNPLMLAGAAGQVAEAIVQHLTSLLGSEVKVRLEIEAHIAGGVPDKVQRDVTENACTLKFTTAKFE